MLVAVLFLLFLLVLSLAVAAPILKKQIQHDRELETMHRGKQYIRAIRLYYKKFGAYPPNLDALADTNKIRFLRKKYADPTTGKADWKLIHFGQNKVPTAWGFFGQPLTTTAIAGVGPGGGAGLGLNGINPTGSPVPATGGSILNTGTDSNTTSNGSPNPNSPSTTGTPGTTGTAGATGTGLTGQTFGGLGIIGVSPNSSKQSILVLHKKNHYNEWEFVYDPQSEQLMMQGGNNGLGGQPAGSNNPATNPPGSISPATPPPTAQPTTPPSSQ